MFLKHEAWLRDAESLDVALSAEQITQLASYVELLERTAVPRGMIAASDADRLWRRHVLDGLRGAHVVPAEGTVADLGSGAGIPGLPLAVAVPTSRFVLTETRRLRASFLEAAIDEIGLTNVSVELGKAEDVPKRFQACVARAFAPPVETWTTAERLLAPGGVLVYWAGESFDARPLEARGIAVRLSTHSDLARRGPLVIMGPQ